MFTHSQRDTSRSRALPLLAVFLLLIACSIPVPGSIPGTGGSTPSWTPFGPVAPTPSRTLPPAPTQTHTAPPTAVPPAPPTSKPLPSPTVTLRAAPTSTRTPAPTLTLTVKPIQINHLSLDGVEQPKPEDVLHEISEVIGAGKYISCGIDMPEPKMYYEITQGELMVGELLISCGWQDGELVTATLVNPAGKVTQAELVASKQYRGDPSVTFSFRPLLSDPPGEYTLTFIGASGVVVDRVNFSVPTTPRLISVSEAELAAMNRPASPEPHLLMYRFAPGEWVRLMLYRLLGSSEMQLIGWQSYPVEADGTLVVQLGIPPAEMGNYYFIAVGEQSGQVNYVTYDSFWDPKSQSTGVITCPGAQPSRVHYLQNVRLTGATGEMVTVYAKPDFQSPVEGQQPAGSLGRVVQPPACAGGSYWWRISSSAGYDGWVPEFYQGRYTIEPLEE